MSKSWEFPLAAAQRAPVGVLDRPGVLELFASQHWVCGVGQLDSFGISRRTVAAAVRSAVLVKMLPGVVAIGGQAERFEARAMALQLSTARSGLLTGQSAGRLCGLRSMNEVPVEYLVHGHRRPWPVPSWAEVTRTTWPDREPRPAREDGFLLASPHRMLLDLAARLPATRFERAAEDAWHKQLVTPQSADDYLQRIRRAGRPGVRQMQHWLDRVLDQSRPATTGLEQLLVDLCRRAGTADPERQHPLRLLSGRMIHLDLAWPQLQLAIEPGHSWWHGGDRAQRADQERDRECAVLGWLVMRFDESVWQRQADAVLQIRHAYQRRLAGHIL